MVVTCKDFELIILDHGVFVATRFQYFKLDALPSALDSLVDNIQPTMKLSDFRELFYEQDEWGNPTKQLIRLIAILHNPKTL